MTAVPVQYRGITADSHLFSGTYDGSPSDFAAIVELLHARGVVWLIAVRGRKVVGQIEDSETGGSWWVET